MRIESEILYDWGRGAFRSTAYSASASLPPPTSTELYSTSLLYLTAFTALH